MDLLEAKQVLSVRLLSASAERRVVGRFPSLRVMDAVAAAQRNVHAVGIGRKIVEGTITDQPCVRLYVVQKLANSVLSADDVLPAAIDGIVTDVIESPPAFLVPIGTEPLTTLAANV